MQKVLRILRISEYVKSRVCGEAAHKCFYIVRVHKILLSEKKKGAGDSFYRFSGPENQHFTESDGKSSLDR